MSALFYVSLFTFVTIISHNLLRFSRTQIDRKCHNYSIFAPRLFRPRFPCVSSISRYLCTWHANSFRRRRADSGVGRCAISTAHGCTDIKPAAERHSRTDRDRGSSDLSSLRSGTLERARVQPPRGPGRSHLEVFPECNPELSECNRYA